MKFIDVDKLIKNKTVSKKTIDEIISLKLNDTTINYELSCISPKDDVILEDTTVYDDFINSSDVNLKSQLFVLNNITNNKQEFICFNQKDDRTSVRTLKQKLADISTGYITKQFSDDDFAKFIMYFYSPLNILLTSYANYYKLDIPKDIVLLYKGGNIFRILLQDILKIFESQDFLSILKRSDVDLQIFIRPTLENYDKVFNDISVLVIYSLMLFKKTIHKHNIFGFFKINTEELFPLYRDEIEKSGVKVKSIELLSGNRKDFSIEPSEYNGKKMILYKNKQNLLVGDIPNIKESKDFFISRNTALSFVRKNDIRSNFDLIRMKKNIQIKVTTTDEVFKISVPCEVIDVSIPKKIDYGVNSLSKNVVKFIKNYNFKNNELEYNFWAPNINYMIKDLDDVLFSQNDYPWSDLKIEKRLIRYFLSLIFFYIMLAINDNTSIKSKIKDVEKEFISIINLLECYNKKIDCAFDDNKMSSIFHNKYKKIIIHINKIKNEEKRKEEFVNMNNFNSNVIKILQDFIKELNTLIKNYTEDTDTKLRKIYDKIIIDKTITKMGGKYIL